jgi:hypothetical protein
MSASETYHPLLRNGVERFPVQVTFDQQRGYVAAAEGWTRIIALSLAGLRRQIDARLSKGVIARLQLDGAARHERDARRRAAEYWHAHAGSARFDSIV